MPDPRPLPGPTPPDAPTPPQLAGLHQLVARFRDLDLAYGTVHSYDVRALASLLRAYEGMRADAERLDWLEANQIDVIYGDPLQDLAGGWICYAHGLPEPPDGSDPRPTAREAIDAARASAPDSEAENG